LSSFPAGTLPDAEWTAAWIGVSDDSGEPGQRPAHGIRGRFTTPRPAKSARLYASALGLYTAAINGRRVGDIELAPGASSYDLTVYAQSYDVADLIASGNNVIEFTLSDGWYRGLVGAFREPAGWGEHLALRAELHLEFDDGSRTLVRTGEDWTTFRSQIVRADLMGGQAEDRTIEPGDEVPVVAASGPFPPLFWSPAPPVRVVEQIAPVVVTVAMSGATIVDFGQNASGWITLANLGPRGTRTIIDYGEHLGPDGDLDLSHLDALDPNRPVVPFTQRDEVVAGGAQGEVFEPRHTVHGFQYARIAREGAPLRLRREDIRMLVVQTDLRRTGALTTSDADLNRLLVAADWSFRGNAVDIPTDCPTRERLGWSGDWAIFAPTAVRMYDVLGFSRKWLQSVRDDQLPDGRIANFSPDGRRVKLNLQSRTAMMTGSAGWGDAIVDVPWTLWHAYGDTAVLAENWDAMTRWVEWALESAATGRHPSRQQRSPEPAPHERYLWDASFHWGEWLEPAPRDENGRPVNPVHANPLAWFTADKSEVATAYLYRSTSRLARISRQLGHADDERRYAQLAERIRDAWRIEFLDADGRTRSDTQASYVRALDFGLVPAELRERSVDRLVELVREAGMHLATGFLSTADLLPVLADTGHADVAYALLFQRSSPSWLGMLDKGATTIWEDWDGIADDGTARESLNHYSKGAVVRFLHTHLLGLRQEKDDVGWQRFVVQPVIGGGVTSAQGFIDTPNGLIEVAWRIERGELLIEVEAAPGTRGRVVFPDEAEVEAGAGRTTFRRLLVPRR
jgi:alpha-L-rhamnosidase